MAFTPEVEDSIRSWIYSLANSEAITLILEYAPIDEKVSILLWGMLVAATPPPQVKKEMKENVEMLTSMIKKQLENPEVPIVSDLTFGRWIEELMHAGPDSKIDIGGLLTVTFDHNTEEFLITAPGRPSHRHREVSEVVAKLRGMLETSMN